MRHPPGDAPGALRIAAASDSETTNTPENYSSVNPTFSVT